MNKYDDNRRDAARQRLSARRGEGNPARSQGGRSDDTGSQRPVRSGKSASLRDLHQVSPEMRERYGVSSQPQSNRRSNRYNDDWDYYEEPRSSRRGGAGSDWRNPSVDPIGGRSLRSSSRGGAVAAAASRINLPIFIGLLVVVLLLVVVIVVAMNRCSEGSTDVANQGSQTEQTTESTDASASGSESGSASGSASGSSSASASAESEVDKAALLKVLDEDVADKLINRTVTSEDAKWIAQNPDKYAMDGDAVQRKLLKLAADEPAAQQYVRNFPEKYPMETPESGQVKTVVTGRNIPRFYQWDELWGYTVYSGTAFGLTGCCPTCLAMVYQGITGNHDLSPYDMGQLAVRDGYAAEYEGTYANFLVDEAHNLDLPVSEIDVTKKALKNALQSNQAVIANFDSGIFTEYGHFVVITGMKEDGTVIMNDPYSEERSNKAWDMDTIVEESIGFYAYG